MPKRKVSLTPTEQSAQFERAAQAMIDAGELNPTEAEAAVDKIVRRGRAKP